MDQYTIAVVEDDEDIRANVCSFLEKSGLRAWGVPSAEDFYVRLLRDKADLVLVDLMLPGEDGLSLIRRLAAQHVPVVVQTARGDVQQRIAGLEAGALQYFVKPTDMNELVAGIRSQLRQAKAEVPAAVPQRWQLDVYAETLVAPNQQAVPLTSREFDLMRCLVAAEGAMVSKADLLDAMGYGSADGGFHRIESMLTRLRRKTQDYAGMPLPVRAVFGRGLVFVA